MPHWIFFVIGAHALNALAFLVDKALLARAVPKPSVYAFFVGILSAGAFLLFPLDPVVPPPHLLVLDFFAGAIFVIALLAFFTALRIGEASRVIPYVGGTIPIWTLLLAYLLLRERLGGREIFAFAILIVGSALITWERSGVRARGRVYSVASFAAVAFAVSSVLMKMVFMTQSFLSGFIWSRAGAVAAALIILLHTPSRAAILKRGERPRGRTFALFFSGQFAGAVGFLTLQYAVSIASPTLVNALQGVQYAIVFLLVVFFGRQLPQLREQISRSVIIQKVAAIIVIGIGLALLRAAT